MVAAAAVARGLCIAGSVALAQPSPAVLAEPIKVVAAESVYGDVVQQVGGAGVAVTSILTHPNQDPHQFEASASTARAMAEARLVVYNGADYDPWVVVLLSGSSRAASEVIEVAALAHKKPGDNPHLWYEPSAMSALAEAVAARLTRIDPGHAADYEQGAPRSRWACNRWGRRSRRCERNMPARR